MLPWIITFSILGSIGAIAIAGADLLLFFVLEKLVLWPRWQPLRPDVLRPHRQAVEQIRHRHDGGPAARPGSDRRLCRIGRTQSIAGAHALMWRFLGECRRSTD